MIKNWTKEKIIKVCVSTEVFAFTLMITLYEFEDNFSDLAYLIALTFGTFLAGFAVGLIVEMIKRIKNGDWL